jgi:hypothetical protein
LLFIQKYSFFFGKNEWLKNKSKRIMAAKNQDGVRYTIFATEIQLKRYLAALQEFFMQIC